MPNAQLRVWWDAGWRDAGGCAEAAANMLSDSRHAQSSSCSSKRKVALHPRHRATADDPGGQEDEMEMTPTSRQEAEACHRESELEKSTCWGSTSPGDHSTDGTGHEVLSSASGQEPGIAPMQVPPGWDVNPTSSGKSTDGGPNDSEQVELEDALADSEELQRERVDRRTRMWKLRKMRRAWRIWRTAWAQHASSSREGEDGEDGEERESDLVEAEEAQKVLDAGNQPAEVESPVDNRVEADVLETPEPKEAKPSESEALELATTTECKDTLQDVDVARSSSREPVGAPIKTGALPPDELEPKELRTPRKEEETRTGDALKYPDTDLSDVEHHDGSAHNIPRIRKPLAPPLVPCGDIDAWSTRPQLDVVFVFRASCATCAVKCKVSVRHAKSLLSAKLRSVRRRAHPHGQHSAFLRRGCRSKFDSESVEQDLVYW